MRIDLDDYITSISPSATPSDLTVNSTLLIIRAIFKLKKHGTYGTHFFKIIPLPIISFYRRSLGEHSHAIHNLDVDQSWPLTSEKNTCKLDGNRVIQFARQTWSWNMERKKNQKTRDHEQRNVSLTVNPQPFVSNTSFSCDHEDGWTRQGWSATFARRATDAFCFLRVKTRDQWHQLITAVLKEVAPLPSNVITNVIAAICRDGGEGEVRKLSKNYTRS